MLIKIIKLLLLGLLTAFSLSVFANLTEISDIVPDYAALIVLIVMLRRSYQTAYPSAFLVALIADALNPELLGVGVILRFTLAVALGEMGRKLDLGRIVTRLYLLLGYVGLFQLLYQAVVFRFELGSLPAVLLHNSLPTLLYTAAVGVPVILLSDLSLTIKIGRQQSGGETF
ncbi:MAG: hypothetical protein ABIJ61_01690 [bacterium]